MSREQLTVRLPPSESEILARLAIRGRHSRNQVIIDALRTLDELTDSDLTPAQIAVGVRYSYREVSPNG